MSGAVMTKTAMSGPAGILRVFGTFLVTQSLGVDAFNLGGADFHFLSKASEEESENLPGRDSASGVPERLKGLVEVEKYEAVKEKLLGERDQGKSGTDERNDNGARENRNNEWGPQHVFGDFGRDFSGFPSQILSEENPHTFARLLASTGIGQAYLEIHPELEPELERVPLIHTRRAHRAGRSLDAENDEISLVEKRVEKTRPPGGDGGSPRAALSSTDEVPDDDRNDRAENDSCLSFSNAESGKLGPEQKGKRREH